MAVQTHIETLKTRHRELDQRIQDMMSNAASDGVEINDLKRQKLQLKDRIESLTAEAGSQLQ